MLYEVITWFDDMVSRESSSQLWMLSLYLFFSCPAGLTEYYLLVQKRGKAIVAFSILSYLLLMLFVLLPIFLNLGLTGCIYGLVLWAFIRSYNFV